MDGTVMDCRRNERENQRKLSLDKGFRDSVADYLGRLYPSNTAKLTARRFDLTLDQARGAVAGKASIATIERIIKTGGWSVAVAILADVIGHSITRYFINLRASHDKNDEHFAALGRSLFHLAPDRRDLSAGVDLPQTERRRFDGDRRAEG